MSSYNGVQINYYRKMPTILVNGVSSISGGGVYIRTYCGASVKMYVTGNVEAVAMGLSTTQVWLLISAF